jgi:hypothetical protein
LRILISFNQKRAEAGASALFKKMLYYVQTTREMLAAAAEVGAKPFLLFQYYLTLSASIRRFRIRKKRDLQPSGAAHKSGLDSARGRRNFYSQIIHKK